MATQPRVQLVQTTDLKKQQRRHRRPRERFLLKYKPYELCPFLFHPVLPGDSIWYGTLAAASQFASPTLIRPTP